MSITCKKVDEEEILAAQILIVDDNQDNLSIAKEILKRSGFVNITTERDPVIALQYFVEEEKVFDILLLDLMMPKINGFDFLEQLCHLMVKIPVLVITAREDEKSRNQAFKLGAHDYVTKPLNKEEMISRVRNLLIAHLAQKKLSRQNHSLEKAVQARTTELQVTQLEIVRRLGLAGEFRDNETGLHVVRMAKYSEIIARSSGMSAANVELLLHAAPMHDIGKIGTPDGILLKPGKLDEKEMSIMRGHSKIGAKILRGSGIKLLDLAAEIALNHHEKWNGSGYPNGIIGQAIPLTSRIVAVADIFDALTSARPYKKAWTVEEAVDYINQESGKHLDPWIVTIFQKVLPEMLIVREQFADKIYT